MDYEEARHLIACHLSDMLPLFADGWGRWPAEPQTHEIIKRAKASAAYWRDMDTQDDTAVQLDALIDALLAHLPKVTTSDRAENTGSGVVSTGVKGHD